MKKHLSLLTILAIVLQGCGSTLPKPAPKTFPRQDLAGTTNIAVLSVDTWEAYVAQLQPNYKIDEAKVLAEVDQVRRSVESTFIDAFASGLKLAPPTSSSSSSRSSSGSQSRVREIVGGETSTSSTQESERSFAESAERGPGDLSAVSLPSGAADLATSPALPAETPPIGGLEPMLKYQAATALFQEIRLLSWYLEKAVQRKNYVPYVVRANVTVTPRARNEPYDTYLNLSFFSSRLGEIPDTYTPSEFEALQIESFQERNKSAGVSSAEALQRERMDTPFVIPLLVTDSLESTIHTNVVDQVRQFAFALLFMVKGFGGQAQFERFQQNLERTTGRDLNSLMTVSRLSDNTYRVRLGAMQQVATSYATIPRNHFITFLLLVPCGVEEVTVASEADWVHAKTGISLAPRPESLLRARLKAIAHEYEGQGFVRDGEASEFAEDLFWVHANKFPDYRLAIERNPHRDGSHPVDFPYRKLWLQLTSLLAGDSFASTRFELPDLVSAEFMTRKAVVFDDGASSKVEVTGKALKQGKVLAVMKAAEKGRPGDVLPINASSVAVSADRSRASLTFPSLKKLSGANGTAAAPVEYRPSELELVCVGCAKPFCGEAPANGCESKNYTLHMSSTDLCETVDVGYLLTKKDEIKPGFTLTATETAVVTDEAGRGSLKLLVAIQRSGAGKKCDKVDIGIRGAGVANVTADPAAILPAASKTLEVVDSGTLSLDLVNLTPALPSVSVSGKCAAGEGKGASVEGPTLQVVVNPARVGGAPRPAAPPS